MDPTPLPRNIFRELLESHNNIKHYLRTPPNIVNCNCEQFELEKYCLLPFVSSRPVFHFLENRATTKTDIALDLISEKCRYNYLMNRYKNLYNSGKKLKKHKRNVAAGHHPSILVNIIKLIDSDPDEYFNGNYNWYYTGGSMDVGEIKERQYIFHMTGDKMNILNIRPYGGDSYAQPLQLPMDETIFGVLFEDQHLILRGKSTVYLFKFRPKTSDLEMLLSCQGAAPFICARLRGRTALLCLDLDHILRIIPLATCHGPEREISLAEHFTGAKEKWASFTVLRDNRLCLVVTQTKLIVVDIISMTCTGSVDMEKRGMLRRCNHLTGVWQSKFRETEDDQLGELVYLSTVHDVIALRLLSHEQRKGRTKQFSWSVKECIRWSHQFKSPPMVLKSVLLDDSTELLYISSLVNNSTKILYVDRSVCVKGDDEEEEGEEKEKKVKEEHFVGLHSYHPPFKPLDMLTSFNACLQQGELIETRYNFKRRLNLSTIGLGIVRDTEKERSVKLLTMTSMGDIYHQKLQPNPADDGESEGEEELAVKEEKQFLEEMRQARNSLEARETMNNVLTITGRYNLKELFADAVFCDPVDVAGDQETPAESQQRLRRKKRRAKWNRPLAALRKYKDVLSQDLLAIWDVSDDEERTGGGDGEDGEEEGGNINHLIEPSEKVSAWLHSAQVQATESMDLGNLTKFEMDDEDVPQQTQEDSQMFRDTSELSNTQQRRVARKKKGRISGF